MNEVQLCLADRDGVLSVPFMKLTVPTEHLGGFLTSLRAMQRYVRVRAVIADHVVTRMETTREGTKIQGHPIQWVNGRSQT